MSGTVTYGEVERRFCTVVDITVTDVIGDGPARTSKQARICGERASVLVSTVCRCELGHPSREWECDDHLGAAPEAFCLPCDSLGRWCPLTTEIIAEAP